MLKGKIISIEYGGEMNWTLIIDGHIKKFYTYQAIHSYLVTVLKKGKDKRKKELLRQDMKNLIQNCEKIILDNKI